MNITSPVCFHFFFFIFVSPLEGGLNELGWRRLRRIMLNASCCWEYGPEKLTSQFGYPHFFKDQTTITWTKLLLFGSYSGPSYCILDLAASFFQDQVIVVWSWKWESSSFLSVSPLKNLLLFWLYQNLVLHWPMSRLIYQTYSRLVKVNDEPKF